MRKTILNREIVSAECKSESRAGIKRAHHGHWLEAGIVWAGLLVLASSPIVAQQNVFPTPSVRQTLNIKDQGALAEVNAFIQAVSASDWKGITGTGTVTYPEGDQHSAQLYLSGSMQTRLDVSMDSGTRSLRIGNDHGGLQDEDGEFHPIPPLTSGLGMFAIARVWADAINSPRVSLYDCGVFTAGEQHLHRITMEYALGANNGNRTQVTMATDLYFDPATHLLWFSVESMGTMPVPSQVLQRVTIYSGYTTFNGLMFPARIEQMLDGQAQWALQLTEMGANSAVSDDMFAF